MFYDKCVLKLFNNFMWGRDLKGFRWKKAIFFFILDDPCENESYRINWRKPISHIMKLKDKMSCFINEAHIVSFWIVKRPQLVKIRTQNLARSQQICEQYCKLDIVNLCLTNIIVDTFA